MYIFVTYSSYVASDISLAIMAQESLGNPRAIGPQGSIGLMQVNCADWMGIECERLFDPEYNIAWGEWFLEEALEYSKGDLYVALQVYNCGPAKYEANEDCGSFYADRVMNYWMPMIEEEIEYDRTAFEARLWR